MTERRLENLARIGELKPEAPSQPEFDGLVNSGARRLSDAKKTDLSIESRFDLAYGAAHALALAGLRWHGYRSGSRYLVFQCLKHTLNLPRESWRVLDQAHRKRNLAEYEGQVDIDQALIEALLRVVEDVLARVEALGPIQS